MSKVRSQQGRNQISGAPHLTHPSLGRHSKFGPDQPQIDVMGATHWAPLAQMQAAGFARFHNHSTPLRVPRVPVPDPRWLIPFPRNDISPDGFRKARQAFFAILEDPACREQLGKPCRFFIREIAAIGDTTTPGMRNISRLLNVFYDNFVHAPRSDVHALSVDHLLQTTTLGRGHVMNPMFADFAPKILRDAEVYFCMQFSTPLHRADAAARLLRYKRLVWSLVSRYRDHSQALHCLTGLPMALRWSIGDPRLRFTLLPNESAHTMLVTAYRYLRHDPHRVTLGGADANLRNGIYRTAFARYMTFLSRDIDIPAVEAHLWSGTELLRLIDNINYTIETDADALVRYGPHHDGLAARVQLFDRHAAVALLAATFVQRAQRAKRWQLVRAIDIMHTISDNPLEKDTLWNDIAQLKNHTCDDTTIQRIAIQYGIELKSVSD